VETIRLARWHHEGLLGERKPSTHVERHSFQVTVVREIPAYAGFYAGYETTKRAFHRRLGPDLPIWALLSSGAIGGVGYWLACYPLDVIKSRVQLAKEPPTRGGWASGGYIGREFRAILAEGGR
jgi:solute carrier family 25 carnitine/acylcarnitine transporter 20/29